MHSEQLGSAERNSRDHREEDGLRSGEALEFPFLETFRVEHRETLALLSGSSFSFCLEHYLSVFLPSPCGAFQAAPFPEVTLWLLTSCYLTREEESTREGDAGNDLRDHLFVVLCSLGGGGDKGIRI